MPEIKNTFLKGKMNKDLDDRLLPEGEYRDAQNIEILKTDGANVGALQNIAGNTLAHTTLGLSDDIDVIGSYFDEKNKRIYWFVTDNNDLTATDWYIDAGLTKARNHGIYYYDADPSSATYKTAKAIVTGRFLKFSKKYKITGIALIDDLLFWTDNKNQPRRINVATAIATPTFYDNEIKISVAKYAPHLAPILMSNNTLSGTSTLTYDSNITNDFIKEEFVRFSYRYKFNDNEYSVLAPFTQIAFNHSYKTSSDYGTFDESAEIRAYESSELDGMINYINKAVIGIYLPTINPNADYDIKEIEFIIKESDSTVARIIETKTLTDADISSTFYTYTYKSDTPQGALPESQITRVFDNVPTKAKALDIVGNRLVFGNYSQNITLPTLDYTVSYGAKGTQTFTGDNSTTTFTLTLKSPLNAGSDIPPNNINQFNVYVNDVLLADSNYTYNTSTGVITFNSAPATGAAITVVLANHEYVDSSLKQRRTYQVGVVLSDIYGRQSPVILPSTASNSIITVPARGTAAEFNSWVGDNLKITFNAQSGKLIPDSNVYSNSLKDGIYATYNPYGWYSYKIVVKQLEQEYYNVYTPGATVVDNNSYITLFGDNINKVPRLMETISSDSSIARSNTILYPKVINTSFYTTTTTTTGTRSATTGGKTATSAAMVFACNQYQIFNRHTSSAKSFKYVPCTSSISNATDLTNAHTTVSLGARKKQTVWSLTFPDLTANADVGFVEVTQLTFNSVTDANSNTGYGAAEFTDPSSGQIIKTIAYNTEKRAQLLSDGDELPITGIGKLSDFSSVTIDTVQEYKRSSSVYDDAGGPFYQRESNHLVAQLPPYSISSDISNAHGVRILFTDDTAADNANYPAPGITSYIKRAKAIDLSVFETKPIESTIDIYYETATSGLINELNALETGEFTSASVTVSNFAVSVSGVITAPTINVGSLTSVEYVNATTDASQTVGYDYPGVSADTTRTARLSITVPDGYTNAGAVIIVNATATQPDDTSLSTTVPVYSAFSITSTSAQSGSAATIGLSATISSVGGAAVSSKGFKYGTTSVYADATSVTVASPSMPGTYTHSKTDASPGTLYYVWAWAINSVGTEIQGPLQATTPTLANFTVDDWTGTLTVAVNGDVTAVAGNSPSVSYVPANVGANSSTSATVTHTLGDAARTSTTYGSGTDTIRVQIPTSGYGNSASTAYLYTATRTVIQPKADASEAYTLAEFGTPSGFSISHDAVFTIGTIAHGTLNSVKLGSATLTDGASTNLSTVTVATLRTLTLNITPGGSFTNGSSAANFSYNIVQPSVEPSLTYTNIPAQTTVINSDAEIDLRPFFTNAKFFKVTNTSNVTSSLISASIADEDTGGYLLKLIGQGSCSGGSATSSAGTVEITAYNEKADVDGSQQGSTASAGVVVRGDADKPAIVSLQVQQCDLTTATLVFDYTGNIPSGGALSTSAPSLTFNVSSIGSEFTNEAATVLTRSDGGTFNVGSLFNHTAGSGITPSATQTSSTSVTLRHSGVYPSVNAGDTVTYAANIDGDLTDTTTLYVNSFEYVLAAANYSITTGTINTTGSPNASVSGTIVATCASGYQFGHTPNVYQQIDNYSSTNNQFVIPAMNQTDNNASNGAFRGLSASVALSSGNTVATLTISGTRQQWNQSFTVITAMVPVFVTSGAVEIQSINSRESGEWIFGPTSLVWASSNNPTGTFTITVARADATPGDIVIALDDDEPSSFDSLTYYNVVPSGSGLTSANVGYTETGYAASCSLVQTGTSTALASDTLTGTDTTFDLKMPANDRANTFIKLTATPNGGTAKHIYILTKSTNFTAS